eukprot:GILK01013081.1.p1 GENE.GILK01013081.1~~GILK01013081.1.p1  ORF type:complete len:715 (+),score=79.39 GILK01013081.1:33-2177(+)
MDQLPCFCDPRVSRGDGSLLWSNVLTHRGMMFAAYLQQHKSHSTLFAAAMQRVGRQGPPFRILIVDTPTSNAYIIAEGYELTKMQETWSLFQLSMDEVTPTARALQFVRELIVSSGSRASIPASSLLEDQTQPQTPATSALSSLAKRAFFVDLEVKDRQTLAGILGSCWMSMHSSSQVSPPLWPLESYVDSMNLPEPFVNEFLRHLYSGRLESCCPPIIDFTSMQQWTYAAKLLLVTEMIFCGAVRGLYNGRLRSVFRFVAHTLALSWEHVQDAEQAVCAEFQKLSTVNEADLKKSKEDTQSKGRRWKVLAATVGGGAALALTGGLAAPVVGSALAFLGLKTVVGSGIAAIGLGGTTAVSGAFGIVGAKVAANKMLNRTGGVDEFKVERLTSNMSLNRIIWVHGLVDDSFISTELWKQCTTLVPSADHYAAVYETEHLKRLCKEFKNFYASTAGTIVAKYAVQSVAARLVAPLSVFSALSVIDNAWSMSLDRATKAGILLADTLMNLPREGPFPFPVTLFGVSIGARVVFSCLQELYKHNVTDIVENAFLLGGPITSDVHRWLELRAVVSGRLVNGWSEADWVLSYLYQLPQLMDGTVAAGCAAIALGDDFVENVNLSEQVNGHLDYAERIFEVASAVQVDRTVFAPRAIQKLHSVLPISESISSPLAEGTVASVEPHPEQNSILSGLDVFLDAEEGYSTVDGQAAVENEPESH